MGQQISDGYTWPIVTVLFASHRDMERDLPPRKRKVSAISPVRVPYRYDKPSSASAKAVSTTALNLLPKKAGGVDLNW